MILYRISVVDPNTHQFQVTLSIPQPAAQQLLSLPVWIPGSYLVREFGRHLSGLSARQGQRVVPLAQLDKATWQAECRGAQPLTVSYTVYAFDPSVRAAFLDADRGFFNGTSLCLRVHGRERGLHRIEFARLPKGWSVATAMSPAQAKASYEAADYDELVDHPFELGTFWRGEFKAAGVSHEFVVAGALPDFDGERLLADAKRICEAQIKFWHGRKKPHFRNYVFLLNAVDDGYGGLEHCASTALIAARRDLPQVGKKELTDGYVTLLGLISHEYFHTWNVKRLRPAEFASYDYTQENYTELLWFFEGFTSYYDDLFLVRAGLIDSGRYLKLLAKTVTGVLAMPGRKVQSVAKASFDAWVKYYRIDENTPNATISYYTKGSLVALALDLTLREQGKASLDELMTGLWARSTGGPITEADIAQVLADLSGRSYEPELQSWVHGTDDLPLKPLLAAMGVEWSSPEANVAQRLGMRVSESALTGVKVSHVLRGGAAEAAGFSVGDELLAVNGWRVRRLDDALRLLPQQARLECLISRDGRIKTLHATLPAVSDQGGVSLSLPVKSAAGGQAEALRRAWLGR